MAVSHPNPYASQPLCHRQNNQKSCSTQVTTAPPSSEKAELGCPNKPVSPTSVSVATESRPTMEDKILRTINTICLNLSPFPPLPQAMLYFVHSCTLYPVLKVFRHPNIVWRGEGRPSRSIQVVREVHIMIHLSI